MTHALRPFQALTSPTLAAIMADTTPPAERARTMAAQLDAMLLVGEFDRLNSDQRCSLRAMVFGLDFLAEAIEAQQQPQPVRRARWWQFWNQRNDR
jgi:hypothetical protein